MIITPRYRLTAFLSAVILLSITPNLHAQMPPGLPGIEHYAIRRIDEKARCKFESVYRSIRANKSDPRVAYIELFPLVHANEAAVGFYGLCTAVSQQAEDNVVVYDRSHAFLHILWGEEANISDAITHFSGLAPSLGVILFVTRRDDEWRAFVFAFSKNKWHDVTEQYLCPFHLNKNDYIVVPQYGRNARVLTYDGTRFRHKLWLTWDGTKFLASTAKKMPGWRCPDSYRYFDPTKRRQYCR